MRTWRPFFLFAAIILTITYAFSLLSYLQLSLQAGVMTHQIIAFLIGCAIFLVLWVWFYDFWKNWMGYFTHELTHAISCVLSFSQVVQFVVNRGRTSWVACSTGNTFISLSPYFLPIFSFIPLILLPLVKPEFMSILYGLMGFTTTYHVLTFITQFRPYQSDLRRVGMISSTIYILCGNVFFLGLITAIVCVDVSETLPYLSSGFTQIFSWISDSTRDLPIRIVQE